MTRWPARVAITASVALAGCAARPQAAPELAPSVGEASFALAFPSSLHNLVSTFEAREAELRKILGTLPSFPADFSAVEKPSLRAMVEAANREGREAGYVDARRQFDAASDFFADAREDLTRKPAGAAQFVARQKGCEVEVGTVVARGLEDAYGKALLARLHKASDAHRILQRVQASLPKEKLAALEARLDEISFASFIVGVELPDVEARVKRWLDDVPQIKLTLDRSAKEEAAWGKRAGHAPADEKLAEKRTEELREASSNLDAAAERGRALLLQTKVKREALVAEHGRAIRALLDALAR